jgi:hypothetical protein
MISYVRGIGVATHVALWTGLYYVRGREREREREREQTCGPLYKRE